MYSKELLLMDIVIFMSRSRRMSIDWLFECSPNCEGMSFENNHGQTTFIYDEMMLEKIFSSFSHLIPLELEYHVVFHRYYLLFEQNITENLLGLIIGSLNAIEWWFFRGNTMENSICDLSPKCNPCEQKNDAVSEAIALFIFIPLKYA